MIDIDIKIKGPGTVFSHEMYLIVDMFKELGYDVNVTDSHPPEEKLERTNIDKVKVNILAEHIPWGG